MENLQVPERTLVWLITGARYDDPSASSQPDSDRRCMDVYNTARDLATNSLSKPFFVPRKLLPLVVLEILSRIWMVSKAKEHRFLCWMLLLRLRPSGRWQERLLGSVGGLMSWSIMRVRAFLDWKLAITLLKVDILCAFFGQVMSVMGPLKRQRESLKDLGLLESTMTIMLSYISGFVQTGGNLRSIQVSRHEMLSSLAVNTDHSFKHKLVRGDKRSPCIPPLHAEGKIRNAGMD